MVGHFFQDTLHMYIQYVGLMLLKLLLLLMMTKGVIFNEPSSTSSKQFVQYFYY